MDDDGKWELWIQGAYFEINNKVENIRSGNFPYSYYQLKRLEMSVNQW